MPTPWRRRLSRIALAIAVVVAVLALPWALAALWAGSWLPRQWDSPIIIAVAADAALVLLAAIWWLWWRLPQALGGAVVLIGTVVVYLQFTQQQQPAYQPILPQQRAEGSRKVANDLLISNQVSKGFEQLAGKETAMRLGGIYRLRGC